MTTQSRIDDLLRRVQEDPASIAFAQLAEEYRRAGQLTEAVDTSRAGLATHPDYVSARVTLGRALLALGRLDDAARELDRALRGAHDNLAATRALAETFRRQGRLADALHRYRAALTLAPNDPDLERIVTDITQTLEQARRDASDVTRARAAATIGALERWLGAIDAARTNRRA
jgi:tetratricopeptide (TPR) repeat protein